MTSLSKRYHPLQRHLTRLAIVQVLYQHDMTSEPVEDIVSQYRQHGLIHWSDFLQQAKLDWDFFNYIISEVECHQQTLHTLLSASLEKEWPIERLENVLRAILLAATAEFQFCHETPAKVIITEYVSITACVYDRKEVGFINKILDVLAQQIRPIDNHEQPKKTV